MTGDMRWIVAVMHSINVYSSFTGLWERKTFRERKEINRRLWEGWLKHSGFSRGPHVPGVCVCVWFLPSKLNMRTHKSIGPTGSWVSVSTGERRRSFQPELRFVARRCLILATTNHCSSLASGSGWSTKTLPGLKTSDPLKKWWHVPSICV